jgi:hypothetical protein
VTYNAGLEQFTVIFKLSQYSNLKVIILTDEKGQIKDVNSLGYSYFK